MPKAMITKEQRRKEMAHGIVNWYKCRTGITKGELKKKVNMPNSTFYRRLDNPGEMQLNEMAALLNVTGYLDEMPEHEQYQFLMNFIGIAPRNKVTEMAPRGRMRAGGIQK